MATELARDLREVARALDKHTENTNIARITGGAVGVVGGILAVAGIIAIPFTAGLSAVVVSVAGGIAGAAGGLTAGGAGIARYFIERNKFGYVREKWWSFCQQLMEELERHPEELNRLNSRLDLSLARLGVAGVEISSSAARIAGAGARMAGTTAVRATAAVGSAALSAVLIGFSLYDIVAGAIEIHRKDGSQAGNSLRKLADSLDEVAEERELEAFFMALLEFIATYTECDPPPRNES